MIALYPFYGEELGQLTLWITLIAGLASAMVNGVTKHEVWSDAAHEGVSGVIATITLTVLLIFRSMLIGVFAGTVTVGILLSRDNMPQAGMLAAAGVVAFIADPLLQALKQNWDKIVQRFIKAPLVEGDDAPKEPPAGGTAGAG